jgi:hypothetical protein
MVQLARKSPNEVTTPRPARRTRCCKVGIAHLPPFRD